MSAEELQQVVRKAINDASFRQRLLTDPDATLKAYANLTADERRALKGLSPLLFEAVESAVDAERKGPWWIPSSFREAGALFFSILTALGTAFMLFVVVGFINAGPSSTQVGDSVQTFQPFDRAKDVFAIVLPLFSAALAYWVGASSEGKRADAAEDKAKDSSEEADTARRQLTGVLAAGNSSLLKDAKTKFPELF